MNIDSSGRAPGYILLGIFGESEVFQVSSNHLYPHIPGRSSNEV